MALAGFRGIFGRFPRLQGARGGFQGVNFTTFQRTYSGFRKCYRTVFGSFEGFHVRIMGSEGVSGGLGGIFRSFKGFSGDSGSVTGPFSEISGWHMRYIVSM